MRSNPRGLALVINNLQFPLREKEEKVREGGEEDQRLISELLRQLGFQVTKALNVKSTVS
jgi:hypothetical protein